MGGETSNIPERVWETPEAVEAASQEEAVLPENLKDEVSDFYGNTEAIKTRLTDRSSKFAAGQIQHCDDDDDELMLNVLRCHLTY